MTDHLTIASSEADARAAEAVEQHHAQMAGALALKAESLAAAVRAARPADVEEVRLDLVRWCREELVPHALAEESTMAQQLLKSMATDWEPSAYKDEYRADLMAMIKKRAKKGTRAVQATPEAAESEVRVLDLMTALKRSMANNKKKPAAKAKRAAPRRKPSSRSA